MSCLLKASVHRCQSLSVALHGTCWGAGGGDMSSEALSWEENIKSCQLQGTPIARLSKAQSVKASPPSLLAPVVWGAHISPLVTPTGHLRMMRLPGLGLDSWRPILLHPLLPHLQFSSIIRSSNVSHILSPRCYASSASLNISLPCVPPWGLFPDTLE